jgi:hypothetical protein
MAPDRQSSRHPRCDAFERPLDRILELCRAADVPYKADEQNLNRWISCCPLCLSQEWDMTITDYGRSVSLRCRGRCDEQQILAALKNHAPLRRIQAREHEAPLLAEATSRLAHEALDRLRAELTV